jgi:antitoxin VapB
MKITKVFKCGNSQAVRLPKDFQFNSEEVEIFRKNNDVIIREIPKNLSRAFELLTELPDDCFSEGRKDAEPQERDFF